MDDAALLAHINDLVAEEQKLVETPDHDPNRLSKLEVTLDQCWDLLRQRRAGASSGSTPDAARARSEHRGELQAVAAHAARAAITVDG